jgi:hypothetical protein
VTAALDGLAVFLVIYYAIRLYPEIQRERGEWIRQITLLRQLIDPGNRSITRDQAKVVLQLVSDAFLDRIGMAADHPPLASRLIEVVGPEGPESITLFGETIEFPHSSPDINRVYDRVVSIIENRPNQNKISSVNLLDYISEISKRDSYRLALLRFGSVNLEQIWRSAYDPAAVEWKSNLSGCLYFLDWSEIHKVEDLLRGSQKEDQFRRYISDLVRYNDRSEYFNNFGAILNTKIEDQLDRFSRIDLGTMHTL